MLNATLYLDNFRGFRNQFIPLKDVNFLVGENSTGKTSLLQLVYLLTNVSWWYNIDFNLGYANLGSFSDIADTNYKDHFTIAIFKEQDRDEEYQWLVYDYIMFSCFMNKNKIEIEEIKVLTSSSLIHWKYDKVNKKAFSSSIDIEENSISFPDYESFLTGHSKSSLNEVLSEDNINGRLIPTSPSMDGFYSIFFSSNLVGMRLTSNVMPLGYDTTWIAPIRAEPQKNYDKISMAYDHQGKHVPYLLKEIFSRLEEQQADSEDFLRTINEFGKASKLWEEVSIHDWEKTDSNAPFEIRFNLGQRQLRITNVGYGISQILPILVVLLQNQYHEIFAIQQPEVHLHPKAQAALGSLVHSLASGWQKQFLIETHSDYILNRYMIEQNQNKDSEKQVSSQVLFFERNPDGTNKITSLEIQKDGNFKEEAPMTYRRFFIDEQLKLLSF